MRESNDYQSFHHSAQELSLIQRYAPPVLVFLLGVAISFYFFFSAKQWEMQRVSANFEREAVSRIAAFREIVGDNIAALQALESFYLSSYEVERSEFNKFVEHLFLEFSGIQTLEWIPRVLHGERKAYEEAAQNEGFAGFVIRERNGEGKMVPAGLRDEYYPVYFVEPHEGNEEALGFDLASDQTRFATMINARESGLDSATSRVRLVQEEDGQFGILVFIPVYHKDMPLKSAPQRRKALKGFLLGVYKVGELLEESLSFFDPKDIDVHVYDDSAPKGKRFLYSHTSGAGRGGDAEPVSEEALRQEALVYSETINIADRKWVVYCTPTRTFLSAGMTWQPLGIFIGGIMLTGLISGYVWLVIGHAASTREHAAELLKSKEELEREIVERERVEEQLRHSQKMEAIGTLTAGIAHEYYNILTAIKGCAELLDEDIPEENSMHKFVSAIQNSVDRAHKITQNLLAYSRKEKVVFEPVNIHEAVGHINVMLEHLKVENIKFEFLSSAEKLIVMADKNQLEHVLMNLAMNAVDAMPEGGTLSVQTGTVEFKEAFIEGQSHIKPGKYVLITVSDTGGGIDREAQTRIFEPFYTTKDVGKGTGLGLAIAYGIIKKHKGSINVTSEAGKGTTFKIYLPAPGPGGQETNVSSQMYFPGSSV